MKRTCVVGALEDTCCADYRDTFVAEKVSSKIGAPERQQPNANTGLQGL